MGESSPEKWTRRGFFGGALGAFSALLISNRALGTQRNNPDLVVCNGFEAPLPLNEVRALALGGYGRIYRIANTETEMNRIDMLSDSDLRLVLNALDSCDDDSLRDVYTELRTRALAQLRGRAAYRSATRAVRERGGSEREARSAGRRAILDVFRQLRVTYFEDDERFLREEEAIWNAAASAIAQVLVRGGSRDAAFEAGAHAANEEMARRGFLSSRRLAATNF